MQSLLFQFRVKWMASCLLGWALTAPAPQADEGLWLYQSPPHRLLRERYGFELTAAWLDHLQRASIRFNSGGSGSFVSADGLLISNHHVGSEALQKLSDAAHDYLRDGFYARTLAEEKPCADLELNVLVSVEDVTARINAAVRAGMTAEAAMAARQRVMAEIEQESLAKSGLRSEVVTLYQGGQYHLYRSRRYTDVRLVFAPEQQIAFFGGDPDNFEYPRFNLDVCLFRVYEDGKPARIQHYLRWQNRGPAAGELTFVSGHPAATERFLTLAELKAYRDVAYPFQLARLKRTEVLLLAWGNRSEENARRARDDLYSVQNSRKARDGGQAALYDPGLMTRKAAAEERFRARLAERADFKDALAAFDTIAEAQRRLDAVYARYHLLEDAQGLSGDLFRYARLLLRAAEERPKPNGERLEEFRDSNRESLELELLSAKPIYLDYEQVRLADALTYLVEQLGPADAAVQEALAGRSPRQRAAELVTGTSVGAPRVRRQLYEGGAAALRAASDPLIDLARELDATSRAVRRAVEAQAELKQQAHAALAQARFKFEGTKGYPDATFTLRLSFGLVKGYAAEGESLPHQTTLAGLFERAAAHHDRSPFDLPPRWREAEPRLNLSTPFNFVGTQDIVGGNSGSPVVNRAGELVGIIFDGNLPSLALDFEFSEEQARAIAVHPAAILEALQQIYDAPLLAEELLTGRRP